MTYPSELRVSARDANPLDAGRWMMDVFRSFTYSSDSNELPIMMGLREGYAALDEYRRKQMERLLIQHRSLEELRSDLNALGDYGSKLREKTKAMFTMVGALDEDSRACLSRSRNEAASSDTGAEREAHAKLRRLGRDVAALAKDVDALHGRAEGVASAINDDSREDQSEQDGYSVMYSDFRLGKVVVDMLVNIQKMIEDMSERGRVDVDEMRNRALRLSERLSVARASREVV